MAIVTPRSYDPRAFKALTFHSATTTSMSTTGVHAGCIEDMWQVAMEIARRAGGGLRVQHAVFDAARALRHPAAAGLGWHASH